MAELPRWRSHKEVEAVQIAAIEFKQDGSATIAPNEAGLVAFSTKPGFRARFWGGGDYNPETADQGYYVRYADGYESWSPSVAFEEGYTRL